MEIKSCFPISLANSPLFTGKAATSISRLESPYSLKTVSRAADSRLSGVAGLPVSFAVNYNGTEFVTLQWNKDGAAVTVLPAGTGSFLVTFSGFGNEEINLYGDTRNNLSKSKGDELLITVDGSYASYRWYVNGNEQLGAITNSLRLNVSDLDVGNQTVTAVVTLNGVPYSKNLSFRVVW